MAALTAELALEITRFRRGMRDANRLVDRMGRKGKSAGNALGGSMARSFKRAFFATLGGLGLAAGISGLGFALGAQMMKTFRQAAEAERANLSFMALTDDAALGRELFQNLRDLAKETGAEVAILATNMRRLLGLGFETEEALELQKSILDIAGALGLTAEESRLLGSALAQVKAKGCHGKGSLIRMADGSVKKVEDILPGETLMGPDGDPRTVHFLARGRQEMFRITPSLGDPFIVNRDHKMRISHGRRWQVDTVTVEDYLSTIQHEEGTCYLAHEVWENVTFEVESIGEGEFFGFNISGDHLYRDAQGFEHHNTASMEEIRQQIAEKGVPVFEALEQKTGLFGKALTDAIANGEIGAQTVIDIFKNLEGPFEKFRGGAAKMAETTGGAMLVMRAHMDDLRIVMGEPINDSLRPIIRDITTMLKDDSGAKAFGENIAKGIDVARAAIQTLSGREILTLLGESVKLAFMKGVNFLAKGVSAVMDALGGDEMWNDLENKLVQIAIAFRTAMWLGFDKKIEELKRIYVALDIAKSAIFNDGKKSGGVGLAGTPGRSGEPEDPGTLNTAAFFMNRFRQAWKEAGGEIFDTEEVESAIASAMEKVTSRAEQNRQDEEERQKALEPEEDSGFMAAWERWKRNRDRSKIGDQLVGQGIGLQGAVDFIFGRSPFEASMDKMNSTLNRIDRNLDEIRRQEPKPVTVNVRNRFSRR